MKPFRPQLESLDDRAMPSVSVGIVGTSLVITGNGGSDVVNVVDRGTGTAGNVFGTINGVGLGRLTGGLLRVTAIDHINFFGKGGNDTFNYALPNGLAATQNIYADLGSGNDTYNAIINVGIAAVQGRLNQTVTGYGGNDTINTQFNGFLGGVIDSNIDGGTGDNAINYTAGLATVSLGVLNTYITDHGDDVVQLNLFDPSTGSAENFQLNANDNEVTVYSAVIGAPNLTTSVLNGDDVTFVNVPTA